MSKACTTPSGTDEDDYSSPVTELPPAEASLDDDDFTQMVLHPRGIEYIGRLSTRHTTAARHFRVPRPPSKHKRAHYQNRLRLKHSSVFLDGDAAITAHLAETYRTAYEWKLNPRRYANLALRHFFLEETMQRNHTKMRVILCERVDEESHAPVREE